MINKKITQEITEINETEVELDLERKRYSFLFFSLFLFISTMIIVIIAVAIITFLVTYTSFIIKLLISIFDLVWRFLFLVGHYNKIKKLENQ